LSSEQYELYYPIRHQSSTANRAKDKVEIFCMDDSACPRHYERLIHKLQDKLNFSYSV